MHRAFSKNVLYHPLTVYSDSQDVVGRWVIVSVGICLPFLYLDVTRMQGYSRFLRALCLGHTSCVYSVVRMHRWSAVSRSLLSFTHAVSAACSIIAAASSACIKQNTFAVVRPSFYMTTACWHPWNCKLFKPGSSVIFWNRNLLCSCVNW